MRILVTGSREWSDEINLRAALLRQAAPGDEVTIIHGACRAGADAMADRAAKQFGWKVEPHPANWEIYGKQAGPVRNQVMVNTRPDICLAFFQPGALNKGTQDCVDRAERAGIPVKRYPEGGVSEPAGDSPDPKAPGEARVLCATG